MATHSSTLALKIPRTWEPGGLQSVGSQSQTQLSDLTLSLFHFSWLSVLHDHSSFLSFSSHVLLPGVANPINGWLTKKKNPLQ